MFFSMKCKYGNNIVYNVNLDELNKLKFHFKNLDF